jgi:hypothetical protein
MYQIIIELSLPESKNQVFLDCLILKVTHGTIFLLKEGRYSPKDIIISQKIGIFKTEVVVFSVLAKVGTHL